MGSSPLPKDDLPDDLANPPQRPSLFGSLLTGSALILVLAGLIVFYLVVR